MSLRDWRQAIRTPPAYRVGNSTLRIQTQFITVIAVIGLIALIILYAVSSYGGGSRVRFTNDLKLHNEEYDHHHVILSQPRPSPIQIQDSSSSHIVSQNIQYNATYPLTKPIKSKIGIKYRIGIISDLDTASRREKDDIWVSYYHRGYLLWNPTSRKVSVTWDPGPVELSSAMAQGGRAMELSELVTFDGRLLTLDDRTGVVYEIVDHANPRVVPWVLLPDGDGHVSKGTTLLLLL
jgi:soluble calcium-activated nucleotidase 1